MQSVLAALYLKVENKDLYFQVMAIATVFMLLISLSQQACSYHVNITSIELKKNSLKSDLDSSEVSPTFELSMTVGVSLNSSHDYPPKERSIPIDKLTPEVVLSQLSDMGNASMPEDIAYHLKRLRHPERLRFISYLRPVWTSLVSSLSRLFGLGTSTQVKTHSRRVQYISECDCRRNYFYPFDDSVRYESTCSDEGTQHSRDQKVISYSLPEQTSPGDYNRTGTYKSDVLENLANMRRLYPGYTMRLYTDLPLHGNSYCDILCDNEDLFWCDIHGRGTGVGDQSAMLHRTWKFLPLGDPSVEIFLSRDIGHPLNQREADAVNDWLRLDKAIHVMRDNYKFHNVAMLGGLWGVRNSLLEISQSQNGIDRDVGKLRSKMVLMSTLSEKSSYRYKNYDQTVLRRVIFYPKRKDIVAHDSYHCVEWSKFTQVRPFPTRRNMTEVSGGKEGALVHALAMRYRPQKCPVECRPSYGKDWEYC